MNPTLTRADRSRLENFKLAVGQISKGGGWNGGLRDGIERSERLRHKRKARPRPRTDVPTHWEKIRFREITDKEISGGEIEHWRPLERSHAAG